MASFLTTYFASGILSVQMNSAGEGRSASRSVTDATAEYLPFTSFRCLVTPSSSLMEINKNKFITLLHYFGLVSKYRDNE